MSRSRTCRSRAPASFDWISFTFACASARNSLFSSSSSGSPIVRSRGACTRYAAAGATDRISQRHMVPDTLLVRRAPFSVEDPWAIPAQCGRVELRRATDAKPSRLRTSIALYADDECLTVVFSGEDDGVVA